MALVLIADDSPTDQHILSRVLEQEGYDTLVASDGAEALALAEQRAPDVILMDVVMPGINGYQATRQLARNPSTASIPVVMVSTKGQDTDRAWGLRQGAVSYLTKPVTAADLVAAIRAALG